MKIYRHIDEFQKISKSVVTIGIFDGVHMGHRKILDRLVEKTKECNGESVLLSFFPHPRMVLHPNGNELKLINSLDEKISLLDRLNIDHIIIHPFSKEFSELDAEDFIKGVLVEKLNVQKLIIGYDHHFGKNRSGSFDQLKKDGEEYGFEVEEIPAQDIKDVHVSSTKIREALLNGNVKLANEFLGYPFFIRGTVVEGDKLGRKINFPTANIYIEEKYKMIPENGVYAVEVKTDENVHSGMLNIGNRPTFPGKDFSIEVHILNFDQDIYGQTVEVGFIDRIRDEIKFEDIHALENQLEKDREKVKSML